MQLHELLRRKTRSRKRVGRGGKRGTTAGRGQKGQKSRAGRRIRPASRDLILRLPKRRGFSNKPLQPKPFIIQLKNLITALTPLAGGRDSAMADKKTLQAIGLLPLRYRGEVKVLGSGRVPFPIVVKEMKASKSVRIEIEKAGGKISE